MVINNLVAILDEARVLFKEKDTVEVPNGEENLEDEVLLFHKGTNI